MKDAIMHTLGYAAFAFVLLICHIFGFERVKKLGYCFIRYSEGQDCDNCQKTNVFRKGRTLG